MFVDSSAFIAILAKEPDATRLSEALDRAHTKLTSGLVRLETVMRLSTKLKTAVSTAQDAFDQLLDMADIEPVTVTDSLSIKAVAAFERYGKGRGHPAQLNICDCMSYAIAHHYRVPLLFIGNDFTETDIESALVDPRPQRTTAPPN